MNREEALKQIRQWSLPRETREILEALAPELAESEDERIRKEIIKFIQDFCNPCDPDCDKWIAYLEKQKEQKPKIIIPKFRIGEYIKPKPYNEKHLIKDINENGYVLDVDFVVPFKDEDVWEVVEQKPSEWKDRPAGWNEEKEAKYQHEMSYIPKPEKPVEWSEEDEKNFLSLCEFFTTWSEKHYTAYGRQEAMEKWLFNRFKYLSLQPKQEWSEEDADILNCCISSIEEAKENRYTYKETDGDTSYDREIDWLKSLRPQPKRSDTYYDIIHNILDMLKGMDFMKITPEHRVSLLNDIRVKCKNADECAAILDEPSWKPSKDEERLINTSISFLKDFADKGYENAVECIDWLKSKLNGNSGK